jgi:hypothetical protein
MGGAESWILDERIDEEDGLLMDGLFSQLSSRYELTEFEKTPRTQCSSAIKEFHDTSLFSPRSKESLHLVGHWITKGYG